MRNNVFIEVNIMFSLFHIWIVVVKSDADKVNFCGILGDRICHVWLHSEPKGGQKILGLSL